MWSNHGTNVKVDSIYYKCIHYMYLEYYYLFSFVSSFSKHVQCMYFKCKTDALQCWEWLLPKPSRCKMGMCSPRNANSGPFLFSFLFCPFFYSLSLFLWKMHSISAASRSSILAKLFKEVSMSQTLLSPNASSSLFETWDTTHINT